jgi:hypothetical protein
MENRSFDNAGPTPQIQGESSIFYYWLVKAIEPEPFLPINSTRSTPYLAGLSRSTLHGLSYFQPPCCMSMHHMLHQPQSLSIPHVISSESFVGVQGGYVWIGGGRPQPF